MKAFKKHSPEFMKALRMALEEEKFPTNEEIDDTAHDWNVKECLDLCLGELCTNHPEIVDIYLLPYIQTTITVSIRN